MSIYLIFAISAFYHDSRLLSTHNLNKFIFFTKYKSKTLQYAKIKDILRLIDEWQVIRHNATIDSDKTMYDDFLMVINGSETAFTTTDGIYVVPIGCLRD